MHLILISKAMCYIKQNENLNWKLIISSFLMFLKSDLRFIFIETEQSCGQGKPCMGTSLYVLGSILALHIYILSFLILCSNNEF